MEDLNVSENDFPYEVITEGSVCKIKCPHLNKNMHPGEVSAQVLRKLADDAGKYLGEKVTEAVITVQLTLMINRTSHQMLVKLLVWKFYELLMNLLQQH